MRGNNNSVFTFLLASLFCWAVLLSGVASAHICGEACQCSAMVHETEGSGCCGGEEAQPAVPADPCTCSLEADVSPDLIQPVVFFPAHHPAAEAAAWQSGVYLYPEVPERGSCRVSARAGPVSPPLPLYLAISNIRC